MSAATVARKPLTYIAGGAAALVVALILISTSSSPAARTTTNGTFELGAQYAGSCYEAGRILGVQDGTPVWVFDEPGHPLANSPLAFTGSEQGGQMCRFTFAVVSDSVPYWVQVGSQPKTRVYDGAPVALHSP
jgi:hypothetical protein